MRKILVLFFIFLFSIAYADNQFLTADQAFKLQANPQSDHSLELEWKIANGYHLYSDAINVKSLTKNVTLKSFVLPQGKVGTDLTRGHYMEYYDQLVIPVELASGSTKDLKLEVTYQGCSDAGLCYPPQTKQLNVSDEDQGGFQQFVQESDNVHSIKHLFEDQNIFFVLISFFAFGLLLAFTPCVFPMLPILSGILAGQDAERMSAMHAFLLSLVYVLFSAITYAMAGIAAGLAGHHIQSFLQNIWVLGLSGILFIILSMSLFGLYELRLPHWLQSRLTQMEHGKKHGPFINAAIMGVFSSLIVSPCVSAPLVGALAYIGGTGNAWLGGAALFLLGLGMGAPLLVIGASAGKILPKAGQWMTSVKNFFGVVLIGMAIWIWSRIFPPHFIMALWGVLAIGCGIFLGALDRAEGRRKHLFKALGIVLCLYGISLFVGALMGDSDPLEPLENLSGQKAVETQATDEFKRIHNLSELNTELQKHQPVLLDFYADWCENCKLMEREVFADPDVKAAIAHQHLVLLQLDMTKDSPEIQEMLKKYQVVAPPTILFFDANGQWLEKASLVGRQTPEAFISAVNSV